MSRVVLVLQARTGSSRLPGKALRPLAGRPMVEHVLRRVTAMRGTDAVVLATTVHERDRPLVDLAAAHGLPVYCGSERDVLGRVRGAAASHRADVVVRVTGDCPLWAPDVAEEVLRVFQRQPVATDYLSNDTSTTGWPDGTDVEVFTREALEAAATHATGPEDREHVTRWIRRERMWGALACEVGNFAHLKLSVDSMDDYDRVARVYAHLAGGDLRFSATIEAARAAGLL